MLKFDSFALESNPANLIVLVLSTLKTLARQKQIKECKPNNGIPLVITNRIEFKFPQVSFLYSRRADHGRTGPKTKSAYTRLRRGLYRECENMRSQTNIGEERCDRVIG